jgi:nicotinate-nucleotide adenylyltransferase
MLASSIAGDPRLTIDDCELKREGISYTVDTVKEIISRYEIAGKPGLIIGDDLVSTFDQWKNAEEIARIADIIIAGRLDSGTEFAAFPYPHKTLGN